MERVLIPRHVDSPQRFLLWTVDQAMPFLVIVGFGIFLQWLFTSIAVGIAVSWFFNRYRESKPDGYIRHLFFWYGLAAPAKKIRSVINPFMRRIYPA